LSKEPPLKAQIVGVQSRLTGKTAFKPPNAKKFEIAVFMAS
jgi:hypothetical protein